MNAEYIQNLRYKLQKRVRRLNSADHQVFHFLLIQFWGFLQTHSVLKGILKDLERRCPAMEGEAEKIFKDRKPLAFEDELENVVFSYFVIKKCVESSDPMIEVGVARSYARGTTKYNGAIQLTPPTTIYCSRVWPPAILL